MYWDDIAIYNFETNKLYTVEEGDTNQHYFVKISWFEAEDDLQKAPFA